MNSLRVPLVLILLASATHAPYVESADAAPSIVSSQERGNSFTARTLTSPGNPSAQLADFAVDPAKVRIQVVDVIGLDTGSNFRTYSLKEAANVEKPHLAISGGSPGGISLPTATGLLIGQNGESAAFDTIPLQSMAIFCVSSNRRISIIVKSEYRVGLCTYALQSGPFVVAPNGRADNIKADELQTQAYGRSIVGIDGTGRVHFIITSSAHLYDLAKTLTRPTSAGGLGLRVAMVLGSHEGHAGLIERLAKQPPKTFGNVDAPLPSAIMAW